jgi:FkbM family methyltransferase
MGIGSFFKKLVMRATGTDIILRELNDNSKMQIDLLMEIRQELWNVGTGFNRHADVAAETYKRAGWQIDLLKGVGDVATETFKRTGWQLDLLEELKRELWNTTEEVKASIAPQAPLDSQIFYMELMGCRKYLNRYFHDFIDKLLMIARYKPMKLGNFQDCCFNHFILKQKELEAVCDKLDQDSIDALYYSIFRWVSTKLFFTDSKNYLLELEKNYDDYSLIESLVPNPYLKKSGHKYEDGYTYDDAMMYINEDGVLKEGMYAVDGGACIGDTTEVFSKLVGKTGKVFAFEPMKRSYDDLVALNIPRTECVCLGLHSSKDELSFWEDFAEGAGSTILPNGTTTIKVTALDDFVEENNIPRIDFIKLDIEGVEMDAIKGMERTIARFKPHLTISIYHNQGFDAIDVPIRLVSMLGDGYRYKITHHSSAWFETIIHAFPLSR